MINQETIQRILEASHIEEVIGEFVSLKKRGSNHIGCCPFHNEKTPSFYVSPSKGIFKCFGCGEAGDVVRFLMKHEHYTYPEALRYLAKKYNIPIEEEELTEQQKERNNERDALFHVTEFAQKYFAQLLYDDEMGKAVGLSYLHERGLSDEIVRKFGLGYCLDKWTDFTDHALKNGYSEAVLAKSSLTVVTDEGKKYDRFRGRVMFPIYSISGRVLGFSGRVLSKEKAVAKYVNTADSDIYNKSNSLYGIFQAKQAISKANKCFLVEGNVDVISMHQSGVENTVASCGTSLTHEQVRLIKRYTPNVTVLYDGDSAGIKAALRAVNILFEEGLHVRVILFPDGEDPDSYAQKYGSTKLQEYLTQNEQNFIKFKTQVLLDDIKGDPIRKADVLREIVETIARVPDMLERSEYVAQSAFLFNIPEQTVASELAKTISSNKQKEYKEQAKHQPTAETPSAEAHGAQQPAEPQGAETVPTQVPVFDTRPPKERKIISLLINNAYTNVTLPATAGEEPQTFPVAALIVSDIQGAGMAFDSPLYQRIFDLYAEAEASGIPVEDSQLINAEDQEIRTEALSLMLNTDALSPRWAKEHVGVPSLESRLFADIRESMLNFKLEKVDHRIHELDARLRTETDEIDLGLLLAEKNELIKLRCQIGQQLKRVVM